MFSAFLTNWKLDSGLTWPPSSGLSTAVAILVVTVLAAARYYRRNVRYTWPPGPRGWPIIGNALLISAGSGQTSKKITRIGKQYHDDVFTLSLPLGKRILILNSYKSIREAFLNQAAVFSGRPSDWPYVYINQNHRNVGVFLETYTESFKRERKYMVRTMRQGGYGLANSQDFILREAKHLVDLIKKRVGSPFQLSEPLVLCLLNVSMSVVFNASYEEDDREFAKIISATKRWFVEVYKLYDVKAVLPIFRRIGLDGIFRPARRTTNDLLVFVQKHIDEHRASLDPDNPRDLLDRVLIEMAKNNPDGDLRSFGEENLLWMMFFFIPDQGDTASGVFTFMMLATILHPEVQEKAYKEIQEVIGDRLPTLEDKDRMPYVEAVMLETLRIDTTFWLLIPHSTARDANLLGYKIPKDAEIIPNIFAAHMDPELWGDPEKFRPERFINENGQISRPEYFMPYSVGRRSCIGEQMSQKEFFLFYIVLLQNFKFKLPDGDPRPKLESQWLFVHPPEYRIQAECRE